MHETFEELPQSTSGLWKGDHCLVNPPINPGDQTQR